MPSWYVAQTRKITMEKWDRPDLYLACRDFKSLPYGSTKDMTKQIKQLDRENPSEEAVSGLLDLIRDLIVEWHMTNPETDEALPKPEKAEDWECLPQEILQYIVTEALGQQEETIPKETL